MRKKYLILDAMGVIYPFYDDVQELLIPFICKQSTGGDIGVDTVRQWYLKASLGQIKTKEFWNKFDLDESVEDDYLSEFRLSKGLIEFLERGLNKFDDIYCLSNDVSEWSVKLREKFNLSKYISKWFISGDMKCRKPSPRIYYKVLTEFEAIYPDEVIFVDDQVKNLQVPRRIGMTPLLFCQNKEVEKTGYKTIDTFDELLEI